MFRPSLGLLVAAMILPAAGAAAQERWTLNGIGNTVTLTNCTACDEDIGMMVTCQGPGRPAILSVPWQAQETPPSGPQADLVFKIDGQSFVYAPQFEFQGLIGHVPRFDLGAADPLVDAMKGGRSVEVYFGGRAVTVSLSGSRKAFAAFDAQCDWSAGAARADAPAQATAAQAQADRPDSGQWYTSSDREDDTGRIVESLTYGIPETDAVAVSATCSSDRIGPLAEVMFSVATGALPDGAPSEIKFTAPGYVATYAGKVSAQSSEHSGLQVGISVNDEFWDILSGRGFLTFESQAGQVSSVPLAGVGGPVEAFRNACRAVFALYDSNAAPQASAPVTYACDNGSSFVASFDNSRSVSTATIRLDGRTENLIEAQSGSGSRYVNDRIDMHTKGSLALLTIAGKQVQCTVE